MSKELTPQQQALLARLVGPTARDKRRLTGQLAWRLWVVVLVTGAVAAAFLFSRLSTPIGGSLATISGLSAPLALLATACWALRVPIDRLPRILLWLGVAADIVGVLGLVVAPGQPALIVVLAMGVWFTLVGLVSGMLAS